MEWLGRFVLPEWGSIVLIVVAVRKGWVGDPGSVLALGMAWLFR